MGRKPNKIPEPPEWLLIANHDALLTTLEIANLLGVCRMTVTNRVSEGTFPKPDMEKFDTPGPVNMRRRGSTSQRLYWKVRTRQHAQARQHFSAALLESLHRP